MVLWCKKRPKEQIERMGQKKYKVLHLTNFLDLSGQQENTLYTVSNLDQERFEASLAANLSGGDQNLDNLLARRAQAIPYLTVHDLPHIRRFPSPIFDLWSFIDMIRLMRAERFDIVHTHATKAGFFGRMAARLTGVPIVVHSVHGWAFQYTELPRLVRDFFRLLEKTGAKVTDRLVTVNQALMEDAVRVGVGKRDQYLVVRSGMELERFLRVRIDAPKLRSSLGLPPTGPIVGTVMIFYRHKSPETLVRIAPRIMERVPETHFLLVGDGEMMPEVRALVQDLNLEGRVVLTGLRQDVNELMALMDVFVHPAWFEILPRTIVQAQATGTPVVATRLGGVPEVIKEGKTGLLVPPRDPEALAEAVMRLLRDPELRARMGEAARASITSAYTVEAMVEAIEAVYDELIEAKLGDLPRKKTGEAA